MIKYSQILHCVLITKENFNSTHEEISLKSPKLHVDMKNILDKFIAAAPNYPIVDIKEVGRLDFGCYIVIYVAVTHQFRIDDE